MPGIHTCEECWYYVDGKCEAQNRKRVSGSDLACTEFANKDDED